MGTDIFHLKQRGTTVRTEIIAGITTFFSMSYILAVNPAILSAAGMPAGTGLNAFFAYTVCGVMGYSYQTALTAVFCEGVVFFLLSLSKARDVFVRSIPPFLKAAIGFFIAFIGLQNGEFLKRKDFLFLFVFPRVGKCFPTY